MKKGCLYLVVGVFALVFIRALVSFSNTADKSPAPAPSPTTQPLGENLGDTMALAAGRAFKQAARNPDSLVIEYAVASKDGKYVCIKYRAQNGFGGMNRESVIFQSGVERHGTALWNRHCMGDDMRNVKSLVEVGVRMS